MIVIKKKKNVKLNFFEIGKIGNRLTPGFLIDLINPRIDGWETKNVRKAMGEKIERAERYCIMIYTTIGEPRDKSDIRSRWIDIICSCINCNNFQMFHFYSLIRIEWTMTLANVFFFFLKKEASIYSFPNDRMIFSFKRPFKKKNNKQTKYSKKNTRIYK